MSVKIAAEPGQLAEHDVLEFPLELQQQSEFLIGVAGCGVQPRPRPPARRFGHRHAAVGPAGGAGFGAEDDWPCEDRLADLIDILTSTLTSHLAREERDGLPLIGVALTATEWRSVGFKIARRNGLSSGGEMFAWILDGTGREEAAATLGTLPPPLRLLYRALWRPRFEKTSRW